MHYLIESGAIASGPHALQSDAIRRATRCGNPELLTEADLLAAGVVPEVLPTLSAGQGYGDPVLAEDGLSVTRPVVDLPPVVPQSVTKRQLYRGLMQVGWLGSTQPQIDAAVNAMVDAMTEPPREIARTEFFTSRDYYRTNALLVGALSAPPLSKTSAEIDEFFILCGSFPADGS